MKNTQSSIEYRVSSIHRDNFLWGQPLALILLLASCLLFLIFSGTNALAAEESQDVALETQPIIVKEPGEVALGEVSITALSPDVITTAGLLLLRIPEDFPVVWNTQVTTLSLTKESTSGLINEAVTYPDEKTLKINVTQNWPKNARVGIVNLRIDIPEFPTYEELFGGRVTNCAGLNLESGGLTLAESSERILLKISPLYSGDDGWDTAESDQFPKSLAKFSVTDVTSSYPTQFLVDRGFTAVVSALDGWDNFIASATDSVLLSSHLAINPSTTSSVKFYTDGTYTTELTPALYTLSSGKATIYAKDATIENVVLKATHQTQAIITGESDTVSVTPYEYSITSNSPQPTLNMQWEEEVQAKDAADQDITTSPPSQVTVSSDGNIKFYPDNNYQDAQAQTSLTYNLTSGKCTIYMKGPISESVHIKANDTYDSLNNDGGGISRAFTIMQALVDVHFDFSYDEEGGSGGTTDKLTIRAWLVKDGLIVTSDLGDASLSIYDFDTLKYTLTVSAAPSDGIYLFNREDTQLSAGQGYFALATIKYQDIEYKGGGDFYVTMDKQVLSEVGEVETKVDELKVQTAAVSDEIVQEISPTLSDIEDKTDQAVTATEQTIPAKIDTTRDELQPHIVSGILNSETEIAQGGTLNIRYRTYADTSPLLDVYDANNNLVLSNQAMTAVTSDDIYEYNLEFNSSWGKGFFTVVCSESTYGTLDGITISVISTDIERVGRDVTAVLGSTADIDKLGKSQDMLDAIFTDKMSKLNVSLVQALEATVGAVATELSQENTRDIFMMMSELSEGLKTKGVDVKGEIAQLYSVSEESITDINYLRNKFIEMENLLAINREMMDTITYEPIIREWYEFR
jgi:hypothetical protein